MKTILSLILATAMTAAMLTGCGCAANVSNDANGMITSEPTRPNIMPTPTATHETTRPTETTRPHATMPTVTGSEPTDTSSVPSDSAAESTTPTDSSNARGRSHMPSR